MRSIKSSPSLPQTLSLRLNRRGISPKVQIENMILAGQRLDKARSQYDFESEEDIDEDLYDPTRSGNYDLADATQSALDVEARLREAALKPSQTAQEAPEEASKPSPGEVNPR